MVYQRVATFSISFIIQFQDAIFQRIIMEIQSKEARIILAIEAIQKSKNLTVEKAAKIYKVPRTTLRDRISDRIHRMETRVNNLNLIEKEEEVLIQYIIDIDERGFASKLNDIKDMANYILESRGAKRIGKIWAHRFVKCYTKLKMCFNCIYDFQRALYEDLKLIKEWFGLVSNI
ncbi:hypothetical protein SS1G_07578 [Sclerotinia sclerotiorum 1980 UF-70]|uniref:HTH CENPB-type domain-containing protein n=1 Tax=Sclerotinia sclerotiorum (strain ATCC 18683 / 1980 / Ss-1) TaxID=665079 RepID=A7EQH6_SCLS1|nr:hypothetical protein SS1G_07578 [Sclerotinia sclerotiorum 1980 UF-70]EDN91718.1 hypothetical protein SS1G_07578 [Sclerotinia sclerotiorum 1980 UF-70]